MNLSDIKLFVLPINAPAPQELNQMPVLTGTFSERIAAAEKTGAQVVLPLSAAEAATLSSHPEVFALPVAVYLSHVPGASYDPLIDASIARLGMNVAVWDAVKAEILSARTETQRRDDRQPWQHKGNMPSTEEVALPPTPADVEAEED